MNHPVKRYKPNDESKLIHNLQRKDLYDGHDNLSTISAASQAVDDIPIAAMPSNVSAAVIGTGTVSDQQIKNEPLGTGDLMPDIKKEPIDGDDSKIITESLYTDKGLEASYTDLDQIFDEENSDGSPQLGVSLNQFLFYIIS